MKKALIISILFFAPLLVQAQSMVENQNVNAADEAENNIIENKALSFPDQEKTEKTTIDINIDLPSIKILPAGPLYSLKRMWEDFKGWFIFNPLKKAEYKVALANKRLVEIETLVKDKKTNLINDVTDQFNKEMDNANKNLGKIKNKNSDLTDISKTLDFNQKRHEDTFNKLLSQIPQEDQEAISKAKDAALKGYKGLQDEIKLKFSQFQEE